MVKLIKLSLLCWRQLARRKCERESAHRVRLAGSSTPGFDLYTVRGRCVIVYCPSDLEQTTKLCLILVFEPLIFPLNCQSCFSLNVTFM